MKQRLQAWLSKTSDFFGKVFYRSAAAGAVLTGHALRIVSSPSFKSNVLGIFGVGFIYLGVSGFSGDIAQIVLGGFFLFASWSQR